MSEPANKPDSRMVMTITTDELEQIVQRAVLAALRSAPREDKLLTVEQVCQILNVKDEWVYHHSKTLPFVRKIGGQLRFSSNGLQRYMEGAKFTVKGG
jgi:excisionase family DNA binding protein